jgi:hypothetical protein
VLEAEIHGQPERAKRRLPARLLDGPLRRSILGDATAPELARVESSRCAPSAGARRGRLAAGQAA